MFTYHTVNDYVLRTTQLTHTHFIHTTLYTFSNKYKFCVWYLSIKKIADLIIIKCFIIHSLSIPQVINTDWIRKSSHSSVF